MKVETATSSQHETNIPSISTLKAAKRTALRRKTWFRILNRLERGVIDLTVKYVQAIKSTELAKVVTAIISKLEATTENTIARMIRVFGQGLARKLSNFAMGWGNLCASKWAEDLAFARYLAINFAGTKT